VLGASSGGSEAAATTACVAVVEGTITDASATALVDSENDVLGWSVRNTPLPQTPPKIASSANPPAPAHTNGLRGEFVFGE
jgi:hypothetical protein